MTKDEAIDWLDEMIENCVSAAHYNDKNRGNKLEALRIAKASLLDTRERVTTLEEWISSFDNCDCGALSQMEQLEIKSMLIELRWRRDEMNDFTETMKDRAEAWLEAYNNQEG